ncbi:MAG: hypothetical protein AMJ65_14715 [Phycisphaerae bacterium SG8_4]|nr:MAG: hypothetical protein AMJ65_14715 [Phycisphaerae bacterium SG8_4]
MLLSVMVVGMFSAAAFALAPMGPPMAGLPEGQYAGMGGYAYSDQNLEISGPTAGSAGEPYISDIQSDMWYGGAAYGVTDGWNIYGALGIADAEWDGDGSFVDFGGDSGFAFAVGVKKTIFTDPDSETVWGTVFQFAQARRIEDKFTPTGALDTWGNGHISVGAAAGQNTAELDLYSIQLAAGPTVPVCEGVCVYGGPFLNFVEGDLEVKMPSTGGRSTYELEQHLEIGAYVGAQMELGDPNIRVGAEFLWTGEAWGFGIGATILVP